MLDKPVWDNVSQVGSGALGRYGVLPRRRVLLDDPTRGVDVAARADMHAVVRELTAGSCRPARPAGASSPSSVTGSRCSTGDGCARSWPGRR